MRDHERVRAQLTAALNAMNGAADAPPGAPAPPYAPYGDYGPTGAAYAEPSPGTGAAAAAEPSLRQLVEQYAADAGVAFLPKAGRRHEGLQARMWVVILVCICAAVRRRHGRRVPAQGRAPPRGPAGAHVGCDV